MEDLKNETIIQEQDVVEQEEMTSVPSTPPSIDEGEQRMTIAYRIIAVCAVFAFLIPLIAFISPKSKIKEKIADTNYCYRCARYDGENLSQRLADTMAVISSVQQARISVDNQEQYLKEVAERKKSRRTFTINGCEFTMIRVDGGTFNMGSRNGDNDESPVHRVTLSSYYVGETEVTQRLWEKVMGYNPSEYKGMEYPVTNVSWNDCMRFVRILNEKYGLPFSLPTEAQWEYAARGGNKSKSYKYSGSNTYSTVANCVEYSFWSELMGYSNTPNVVRSKSSNELGIFDMSGNVKEWCFDNGNEYESSPQVDPIDLIVIDPNAPSYSAVRGGGYLSKPNECRSTYRDNMKSESSSAVLGFRLVLNDASEVITKTVINRTTTKDETKNQSISSTDVSTRTPIRVIKEVNVEDLNAYIQSTKK